MFSATDQEVCSCHFIAGFYKYAVLCPWQIKLYFKALIKGKSIDVQKLIGYFSEIVNIKFKNGTGGCAGWPAYSGSGFWS